MTDDKTAKLSDLIELYYAEPLNKQQLILLTSLLLMERKEMKQEYIEHRQQWETKWKSEGEANAAGYNEAKEEFEHQTCEVRQQIATAMEMLSEWEKLHDSPCRLDHHGLCQEHFLQSDCVVVRTRKLIGGSDANPE